MDLIYVDLLRRKLKANHDASVVEEVGTEDTEPPEVGGGCVRQATTHHCLEILNANLVK